jgi:hypothetical protein
MGLGSADFKEAVLFEHRFWLQILGDHARFIRDSLVPKEEEEIRRAGLFVAEFDRLLGMARTVREAGEISQLTETAHARAQEIRAFKLRLLRRKLEGHLDSGLPATFFNHMVNENEEYLRLLHVIRTEGRVPVPEPVHLHLLWLLDGSGHALSISANLDLTERRLRELSDSFAGHFDDFYMKAVELAGYLRTNLRKFPALALFHKQVELEMVLFMEFLRELEEMGLKGELLGTFYPLMADHMAREECYYLTKLSLVAETKQPSCDPGKPRTEK